MANATVLGVVKAVNDDRDAKIAIIEETRGQFTDEVAVRFWGKSLPLAAGLIPGARVYISGYVKSKKSNTGDRYWTEFSAAQVLIAAESREPGEDELSF